MEGQRQESKAHYHSVNNSWSDFENGTAQGQSPEFHHMLFANEGIRGSDARGQKTLWWWIPEILSLLLGAACLATIIAVLVHVEDRPPPQWPLNVTLNTFLAFFTSLAKVAYMIPVVAGLGQLKWMWFMTRHRPLVDFQVFDEASRGSWGCIKLMYQFKGIITCLGALITLSSLFTSTITQQAVQFQQRRAETTNGTAEVQRAQTFSFYNGSDQILASYDTHREKHALVDGAFFVPNQTIPHISPTCSSGDCKWEPYGSLALCSDVVNITATGNETLLADLHNKTMTELSQLFNSTLSSDSHLAYGSMILPSMPPVYPIIVHPTTGPTGMFNASVNQLMASDNIVAYSDTLMTNLSVNHIKFYFLEHASYWCTKSLLTTVHNGDASTTELVQKAKAIHPIHYPLNFAWTPEFGVCYLTGTCNTSFGGLIVELEPPTADTFVAIRNQPDRYIVDIWASLIASALISDSSYGGVLLDSTRGFVASSGGSLPQAFAISLFGDFMQTGVPSAEIQMNNVRGVSQNMVRSLTNLARQIKTHKIFNAAATPIISGTVFAPQTYVQIRWVWLSMLAAQLALTLVFIIAAIASTRASGVQILKGSSLATMCGLDKNTRKYLGDINDLRKLGRQAEGIRVMLERGSSGTALWLAMEKKKSRRPETWQPVPNWGVNPNGVI